MLKTILQILGNILGYGLSIKKIVYYGLIDVKKVTYISWTITRSNFTIGPHKTLENSMIILKYCRARHICK